MSRSFFFYFVLLVAPLWTSEAAARGSLKTWAPSCTLDVVLVTFNDTATKSSNVVLDYHLHDRPHGSNDNGTYPDPDSSYTLREFERLFSGGYGSLGDSALVGDTVKVAKGNHTLPKVFGSVKAYYDSMSNGAFDLHVRMINAKNGDYPRWIQLPQTKEYYHEIDDDDFAQGDDFWNHAERAAQDSVDRWYPDTDEYDIPNNNYSKERRVRHKVAYVYSGAMYAAKALRRNNRLHGTDLPGLLHPQADQTTNHALRNADDVGYRYVMGEREGWGNTDHDIDEFAGIGLHVHEIGHLLGLKHGEGEWEPNNSDESSTDSETTEGANFVGWGLMQGGREGPKQPDGGLSRAYSSCPVPINPFYRMDLGWLDPTEIAERKTDYPLALGSVHMIDVGTRFGVGDQTTGRDTLLLERRSNNSFGRYISFYEYANQDPGLFIWRRGKGESGQSERPILIVADGQRIRDASDPGPPKVEEYQDQLSDPFPGSAGVNAVYATTGGEGLRQQTMGTYGHLDPGNLGVALTDIRRGINNDALTLDVQLNYWAGDIVQQRPGGSPTREFWGDGNPSWDTGTVYVAGDLTIEGNGGDKLKHKAELTIARGTKVRFLSDPEVTPYSDDRDAARSELIVEGELTVGAASGVSDGGVTFRSDNTVDPSITVEPSNDDWYGIRVRPGGTATLSDVTIRDGSRCVQNEGGTLTMTNVTLSNCGATVRLDRTLPYAEQQITATLTPAARDEEWQWQRRRRSTDAWTNIASAETATYTPDARDEDAEGDEGWQLRATVRYQAEANVYPHAQSAATVPVAGVPSAPPHFMASPGDGRVVLRWDAAAANGSPIVRYEVQWRRVSDPPQDWSSSTVPGGSTASDTTITELTNGQRYEFAVRAVNGVGDGASASQSATPQSSIVRIPLTASRGDGQVTLNWSAPSGSVSIHEYEVRRRISDSGQDWSGWVEVSGGSTARDTTVTGLTNGKTYQFQVQAVDSQEARVAVSDVVSATPAAVPAAPPHFMPFPGDGQVLLEWEAAANNGSRITRYEIQWRQVSEPAQDWSDWVPVSGGRSARDTTMTGLTNGQRYEFAVRAVNGVGNGASIAQVAMPQALSLTASGGDGQVGLNWTSSAHSSTIAHYQVRQRVSDSGQDWSDWATVPGGTSARDTTVTGLTNGTTYQFQAQAIDSQDALISVSNVVSATPAAVPDAPPHFMPFPGDGQVLLEWEAAANNGSRITRYEIQWRQVSDPEQDWSIWAEVSGGRSARDTTVTGLTNGQGYEFAVRAVNGVGDGASIAQVAMPQALSLTASGGDGQVGLNWTFSAHSSTIAHYQVRQRISDSGQDWSDWATVPGGTSARDTTVTGLTNGVTYQFQAQAIDSQGASISVSNIESATPQPPETQYAYRASQTTPLFDTDASGTPDNWSPTFIPWTDAAPRVWQISRMRPQGGSWSEWGDIEKASERPAASPVFYYIRPVSAPSTPGNTPSEQPPSGWQTANPGATATADVWRTERTRPAGETHYRFSTPIQIQTEYAYRLHTSGTTAPAFSASAGSVPTDWSSTRPSPDPYAPYVWQISRTRPTGGSWSHWGSATVVSTYTERQYAYRVGNSGSTAPSFSASASGLPTGWSSSRRTPGPSVPYEWEISRTRPAGESWSSWGSATVVSTYTERQSAYRRNNSGSGPPTFSATASGVPTGWSSSRQTPTSSNRYEWKISRTRPAGESWSNWGGATVVSTYTERQYAYRVGNSGSTAPSFSASASGLPTGWSSSRQTPGPSVPYEWEISRTRPTGGSWSSWGSATVVSKYTERQSAYRRNNSGSGPPSFSASASGVPSGWSSSRQTPTSSNRYEWKISRTRPAGESWSNWGGATVVATYTERQYAYRVGNSGSTPPSFSASASGLPTGWSSSRRTPGPSVPYEWEISRTRPTGGSWSSWGSATVVSKYTERQSAYRRNNSGSGPPSFSATASGVPSGWSSSRQTPTSSNRYEWKISRTRPAGESWSNWGGATVVSRYTERQTAYQRNDSGTTAPAFSSTASGVPSGWSSSQPSATSSNRYVWRISRTRPAGGSWSSWGSATVVSRYTQRQSAYQRNDSGTSAPAFSASASGVPSGWSSSRQSPTSSHRYEWRIRRTRPAGESWSNWGSATVVRTYTETQYAYKISASGSNAPSFSASASGVPSGWSSSRQTPISMAPYEWRIRRTRPAGGSWSNWGSATVVRTYTETQYAYKISASGSNAPSFSASASGVPSGWSSSRQTPVSAAPYEWRIRRTRPAGGSWSHWGGATVVNTLAAAAGRYRDGLQRLGTSALHPPAFTASFSGMPTGGASLRPTPTLSPRYEGRIRRARPTAGS